ncbi:MAG: DoxX family protein [Pseudomonadota bacterium]
MASSFSIGTGRLLLGLYFILPGLMKVGDPAGTIAYMESHSIPLAGPLMWVAAAANLAGGVLLASGRYVRWVSYAFVLYVLIVNALLHDFWTMEGDEAARETQNFIKNMGIAAGLLTLAGYAPNRVPSLTGWWRSDAAVTGLTT